MMNVDQKSRVAAAHTRLQSAESDLEDAVRLLPGLESDNTMASSSLLDVLQRVSAARHHLNGLTIVRAPDAANRPPAGPRTIQ
jgi:hypothetical protein